MFEADLLLSMVLMSLLFLRHITVYKDRNKINYTPVVLVIGTLAGLIHFVMMGDSEGWLLALRESLLTVIVGVILSAIMSVMSQTQNAANYQNDTLRIESILHEIDNLKSLFTTINARLGQVAQMEDSTHEQLKSVFKEEIDALNTIQSNQKLFIHKIESMLAQQQEAMNKFEDFTLSELPSLDNVVHRHIDMLRISEQDHFNQLKIAVKSAIEDQKGFIDELSQIRNGMEKLHKSHSLDGVMGVLDQELSKIIAQFSHHIQTIGSKSESIVTTLLENEKILKGSREQSELIMQQMVLSSNQMREMNHTTKDLSDSIKPLSSMFNSADSLIKEFLTAKSKLHELVITLESYEKHEHRALREHLENVANEAIAQMQLYIQTIEKHQPQNPAVTAEEVQHLAHKVKLHQSYNVE